MTVSKYRFAALSLGALLAASEARATLAISADPTANMSCTAGVCTPTATDAVLNTGDLTTMLIAGAVTVSTTGAGVEANDIRVTAPFSWSAASPLALDAQHTIVFASSVTVAGTGGVSLTAGTTSNPVPLFFLGGASLTFTTASSALSINGTRYKLETSLERLARDITARPNRAYALANDYSAYRDGVFPSSPIVIPFAGKFTGLGHVISQLRVADASGDNVGVFSTVTSTGSVANIGITKSAFFGEGPVGGLIGTNQGSVSNSFATGTINGHTDEGGLVALGGLVGDNAGTIKNCWANVRIINGYYAGGIAGRNQAIVDSSFANGSAEGYEAAGGLVGWNTGNAIGSISNSYATGSVKLEPGNGSPVVGGIAGFNPGYQTVSATVSTSYSTGTVRGFRGAFIGGSVGYQTGVATAVYWDTTTGRAKQSVGYGDGSGITGLTTTELQSGLPAGFDPALWGQNPAINDGFPYLLLNPPQ